MSTLSPNDVVLVTRGVEMSPEIALRNESSVEGLALKDHGYG